MVKKKKVAKKKTKKSKVKEIFEVEKKGEEKIVEKKGAEEILISKKDQNKQQNKQLKYVLILIGFAFFLVFVFSLVSYLRTNFEYEGVEFNVVKEGEITFYHTSLPVIYQNQKNVYNFYIRKDPRKLKDISFEGDLFFTPNMVINFTEEFNCDGDGVIAVANLVNLYGIAGTKVIKDENASCDEQGRYMFVRLQSGNKTEIKQFGPACYNLYVKDCEILEATERFMLETFVKLDGLLENES